MTGTSSRDAPVGGTGAGTNVPARAGKDKKTRPGFCFFKGFPCAAVPLFIPFDQKCFKRVY
jgi:hypothetical protein